MTEEEYQKEAEEETRRGLEELRKHCNSPEFKPWKTVSRLQSPKRFICDGLVSIFRPNLMKKKIHLSFNITVLCTDNTGLLRYA